MRVTGPLLDEALFEHFAATNELYLAITKAVRDSKRWPDAREAFSGALRERDQDTYTSETVATLWLVLGIEMGLRLAGVRGPGEPTRLLEMKAGGKPQ